MMNCDGCGATCNDETQNNPLNMSMYTKATKGMPGNLGWAIVTVAIMAPIPDPIGLPEWTPKRSDLKPNNASIRSCVDLCPSCLKTALNSVMINDTILKEHPVLNFSEMEQRPLDDWSHVPTSGLVRRTRTGGGFGPQFIQTSGGLSPQFIHGEEIPNSE